MGRGRGKMIALLLTVSVLCIARVEGDIHPAKPTLRKDLPQIIPASEVASIVLDDYKLCGDAYVIKSLYFCEIGANGLPQRRKCENLCGDPDDDVHCTKKCPIYKLCVLGLSGQNETMCLRFFDFKTHAEVMEPPTTEAPTTPETTNTTVEATTIAKETVKAKELVCPLCINCDAQPVDCDKCPAKEDIPSDLRYKRLLEINREQLKEIRELKALHNRNSGEQCHYHGQCPILTVAVVVLVILFLICAVVIGVFVSGRLRSRPNRAYGGPVSTIQSFARLLGFVDRQHEGADDNENLAQSMS